MKKRNVENSVLMLKKLRDMHHCQLDISVVGELNQVIADLEKVGQEAETADMHALGLRVLQLLYYVRMLRRRWLGTVGMFPLEFVHEVWNLDDGQWS